MNPRCLLRTLRLGAPFALLSLSLPTGTAAEVTVLPAPTEVIDATGSYGSYHNRDDGFGATSDRLDMTFRVCIDFDEKTAGTREVIWETGGGTIGTSVVYEAPSTIVMRSDGNGGLSLLTVQYPLSAGEIAAGPLEVGWTYDVSNANGTQSLSLIVNGLIVATDELDLGGDWSGSDGAKFGNGGGVAGSGANGTITAVAFTSGTIDLDKGLEFYADTLWLPVADDTDADGLPDAWEEIYFPGDLDELAAGGDNDGDGLDDEDEFSNGTDPTDDDTDDDELSDGQEANPGAADFTFTDPNDADSDDDGRSDGDEVNGAVTSDPNDRDTDSDRFVDGAETDAGSNPNLRSSTPPIGGFLGAYWPLDSLDAGGIAAPDLAGGGLDLVAWNLDSNAVVTGRVGNAIAFDAAAESLLCRDSAPGEDLPISQHQDYTVAMWVKVVGTGQSDLRMFSEASRVISTPEFGLGTHDGGADNSLDVSLRNTSGNNSNENSAGMPLDGSWHHIAWVRFGESFELYIDGVLDAQAFTFVDPFVDGSTTTTALGGTHASLPLNWVTGVIDEVSLWKVALPEEEIAELATGTAANLLVEDGDMDGMPDAWELANGLDPDSDADAAANDDADDLTNLQEYRGGTDPNSGDTDGDGLPDHVETNTGSWAGTSDTGTSPRDADSDGDGLSDGIENPDVAYNSDDPTNQPGTDPNAADSDADLVGDGGEIAGGSNPTSAASVPEPEAYFSWCPDDEPLGDTYGADGVIATTGANPPVGGLEAEGAVPVVAISDRGAAQTDLSQALDFDGSNSAYFRITPEPNALRDMLSANAVQSDGTLEFLISPDSLQGTNQYHLGIGGTGDGHGLVLVGSTLHFGVNSNNNDPIGNAIASIDLTPLYGALFNPDDYLLVRVNALPLSQIVLGVTHLGTGLNAVEAVPWTGNSWDGGDPLALGRLQGGRGGDRDTQLSRLTGASTTWAGFDGQIAKFSVYPGVLPPVENINTETFRITSIEIDAEGMITIEWTSFPGEVYLLFSSTDLVDFSFEISDGLISDGETTSFTFPNEQPDEPRLYFRLVKEE